MSDTEASVHYHSYLALDEILGAQRPRSEAHDEVLFIVIHQVYELWFKQLLHEAAHLQRSFEQGDGPRASGTLRRIREIVKIAVSQLDVLETLTPPQYVSFRDRLDNASGFQSAQFRELEAVFGRRDERVLEYYGPDTAARARIADAMSRPSVFDSFLGYLAGRGYPVSQALLERDPREPCEGSEEVQDVLLLAYRDDGEEAQVCERLIDLDEGLQEWRYRHVRMVERMIGLKVGTGGSEGAAYLRTTLFRPAFPDLWAVRNRM